MLNQVSIEAVYSATYVENYLDCVENLPDELQRLISRMRELDVCYLGNFLGFPPSPTQNLPQNLVVARVRDAAHLTEALKQMGNGNPAKKARNFARMQQSLIAAQELGDEKMNLLQTILDKIEIKTRLLDQDFKNLGWNFYNFF